MLRDLPAAARPQAFPAGLPAGSYVMGLTPFNRDGDLDEVALREHARRMARENTGFWPASPATGEGSQMSDAEIFRVLEIVAEETGGLYPVVAGNREHPTAAANIRFAREAASRGAAAVQLYPPTLGHSFTPTAAMLRRFYDEVLDAVDAPVVLSSNFMTGFEVPAAVFERPVTEYPNVVGIFKHHPDQGNVAEFAARFGARTTVLTMAQKLLFAAAVGAAGALDNLQNVAPRLCFRLHDALRRGDLSGAGAAYLTMTRLLSGIAQFSAEYSAPRVVTYKAMLGILGMPGGYARPPYLELEQDARAALARMIDAVGLRETEGLT